jgi:signal transduction histidine kinase
VYTLDESEISRLCQQTNYLIHLVNDLRELSMAEAGKLALKRSAVDLEVLGEECLADLGPLAEDRGITLAGTWEALPILSLDSLRIRQILINLLSNAIRHSPDNGQVTLAGRLNQQTVELSVTDHGQGLEADQLAAVFDRFYRVDPSRSRESGGSGLGLSIARALAQSHGGDLTACSQGLGTGATFTLVLPRA